MMDIKSQIAPKGLEFKPASFIISDKHATILTVIGYPKYIYPGYLASLTSMSGIKLVIKNIPLPFRDIKMSMIEQFRKELDKIMILWNNSFLNLLLVRQKFLISRCIS